MISVDSLLLLSLALVAPVLRSADVKVTMSSPTSCAVTMGLTIEGAEQIEHRVDVSVQVDLLELSGARAIGGLQVIGRTFSLRVQPLQETYQLRYRAQLAGDREFRCPLWLPTIPTDGQSRAVALAIEIPAGSTPSESMPVFAWTGARGEATLGHLPAFLHVPFAPPGADRVWSIAQVMDAVTLIVIVGASVIWVWCRKRSTS